MPATSERAALREPRHDEYATPEEYERAWYTWRAQRRDCQLTRAEADAQFAVIEAHVRTICRR